MNYKAMREELEKLSYYNVPDEDVFSSQSAALTKEHATREFSRGVKERGKYFVGGALAPLLVNNLSKAFLLKSVPRNPAILGSLATGALAAYLMGNKEESQGEHYG